jgi:hypothetical protein
VCTHVLDQQVLSSSQGMVGTSPTFITQPAFIATASASVQLLSLYFSSLALFMPSAAALYPASSLSQLQNYVVRRCEEVWEGLRIDSLHSWLEFTLTISSL